MTSEYESIKNGVADLKIDDAVGEYEAANFKQRPVEILQSIVKLYKEKLDIDFEPYFSPPLEEEDITTEMRQRFPEYLLDIYRWRNGSYDGNNWPIQFRGFIIPSKDYLESVHLYGIDIALHYLYDRRDQDLRPLCYGRQVTWQEHVIPIFGRSDSIELGLDTRTHKIASTPVLWEDYCIHDVAPEDWIDFVEFLEQKQTELKEGKVEMTPEGFRLKGTW